MPTIIDKITQALRPSKTSEPTDTVFHHSNVVVIFVLGGPGAGKGTQCARLVEDFGFCHLSAGDLLRAEQTRQGSEYSELIQTYIREGKIVPMEVTVKLLENAMRAALKEGRSREGWGEERGRFLIDGFPRKLDQAAMFEERVCKCTAVLFYKTTEEVLLARLLERGKTSGREDDNAESIKKRFMTYEVDTMPVIDNYRALGKLIEIDSTGTIDEVHAASNKAVLDLLHKSA